MSAKLRMNYERDVFLRDIAEGYVKGNHTFDEMTSMMYTVLTGEQMPEMQQPERTIGDLYNELKGLVESFNPKNQ